MKDMSKTRKRKNPAAVALGRKGGKVKSAAKTAACRQNWRGSQKTAAPVEAETITEVR